MSLLLHRFVEHNGKYTAANQWIAFSTVHVAIANISTFYLKLLQDCLKEVKVNASADEDRETDEEAG